MCCSNGWKISRLWSYSVIVCSTKKTNLKEASHVLHHFPLVIRKSEPFQFFETFSGNVKRLKLNCKYVNTWKLCKQLPAIFTSYFAKDDRPVQHSLCAVPSGHDIQLQAERFDIRNGASLQKLCLVIFTSSN